MVIEPISQQTNGTATFPVTRGKFNLVVVGGRSQSTHWLQTGVPSDPQMSDWDVTFQSTRKANHRLPKCLLTRGRPLVGVAFSSDRDSVAAGTVGIAIRAL
jgi:hypothetical protein